MASRAIVNDAAKGPDSYDPMPNPLNQTEAAAATTSRPS